MCVIWNRFSANDPCAHTHHPLTLCPPSATQSSHPHPTSLRSGQYHPFVRNAGLFQRQCPMAVSIQAPIHPFWSYASQSLVPDTQRALDWSQTKMNDGDELKCSILNWSSTWKQSAFLLVRFNRAVPLFNTNIQV